MTGGELATTETLPVPANASPRAAFDALAASGVSVMDVLRYAVLYVDEHLPELAGQTEPLAHGHVQIDQLRKDMAVLRERLDGLLLAAMGDNRTIDVPGVGRVQRWSPRANKHWASPRLVHDLIHRAVDPEGTGEVPAPVAEAADAIEAALMECVPLTQSLGWRVEPLKERGFVTGADPDELAEAANGDRVADRAGYMTYVKKGEAVRFL